MDELGHPARPAHLRARVAAARLGAPAARELLLVAVVYVLYSLSRVLTTGSAADAMHNAGQLMRLQQALGVTPELWLNQHVEAHLLLALGADYFYASLHYVVTPAVLVWMWRRHRSQYARARLALVAMTLLGLAGFALFPLAPPRMLPGFVDTMAAFSGYGWWGEAASAPRGLGQYTNQLAAMPSLHVAWAAWSGWLLARYASRAWLRGLGAAYPVLTSVVVMATANHYVLDVVGGVAAVALGVCAAVVLTRLAGRARVREPAPSASGRHRAPCRT